MEQHVSEKTDLAVDMKPSAIIYTDDVTPTTLYYREKSMQEVAKVKYDRIYALCIRHIISCNIAKKRETVFMIPVSQGIKSVVGYNPVVCIAYIIKKLRERNFDVKYNKPNILYISWFNDIIREEIVGDIKFLEAEHEKTQILMRDFGTLTPLKYHALEAPARYLAIEAPKPVNRYARQESHTEQNVGHVSSDVEQRLRDMIRNKRRM